MAQKNKNEEISLSEIVENEEDKKILEPVKKVNKVGHYIIGIANANNVYVRKEPDKYSEIVYILKNGATVTIDPNDETYDYFKVTVESVVGYVLKEFISITD